MPDVESSRAARATRWHRGETARRGAGPVLREGRVAMGDKKQKPVKAGDKTTKK
ncbi:hypothetical protein [Marinovum sp.]|uniref:hypothetical protein n=1 Tax=Marinovum sp. TaxID=2024839 RepID=UPI003A934391